MRSIRYLAAFAIWALPAHPGPLLPAAYQHVRYLHGQPFLFTSRLRQVIDLRFTLGDGHEEGKRELSASLDRIAAQYGKDGAPAFAIQRVPETLDSKSMYLVPPMVPGMLLSGDVIVANNVSNFASRNLGSDWRVALQEAVETAGKGFLAVHATGEYVSQTWDWLNHELLPVQYTGHYMRVPAPVYKEKSAATHLVLEGILQAGTDSGTALPEAALPGGSSSLSDTIRFRRAICQQFMIGNDFCREDAYRDRCTLLMKMDFTGLDLPRQFLIPGGNPYSWVHKVGAGVSGYIHGGHQRDEILGKTGFDGGVGDWDRYVAQMLFFLAGYRSEPCTAACGGLPIVDDRDRLTGERYQSLRALGNPDAERAALRFDPDGYGFRIASGMRFSAYLTDVSGRIAWSRSGSGPAHLRPPAASFRPGKYVMLLRAPGAAPITRTSWFGLGQP
jgi:hypothetical protein